MFYQLELHTYMKRSKI